MKSLRKALGVVGSFTKGAVISYDQAPHTASFTYDKKSGYKSLMGGVCGLLVFFLLGALFISNVIKVVVKSEINATEQKKISPEAINVTMPLRRGMMFAIGVEQLDLRYEKIFNFRFSKTNMFLKPRNQSEIRRGDEVKLVPCTRSVWESLDLQQFYDKYQMQSMLCPDPNEIMKLTDKKGYRLQLERCSPQGPWPANASVYQNQLKGFFNGFKNPAWTQQLQKKYDLTTPENGGTPFEDEEEEEEDQTGFSFDFSEDEQEDQDELAVSQSSVPVSSLDAPPSMDSLPCLFEFYEQIYKLPRQYRIQFYYANTLINAKEQKATKRFVDYQEFNIELTDMSSLRIESEISLASFDIKTNNDIFLGKKFFEDYLAKFKYNSKTSKGLIRADPIKSFTFSYDPVKVPNATANTQKMDNYLTLDITRSSQLITVERTYKTILDAFNELGGLFTFFGLVLGFIYLKYNELCFKVEIVESVYYNKKNQPLTPTPINYFNFTIYRLYNFLGQFGFQPNWKFCEEWKKLEGEVDNMLDIGNVVRKVQHLERVGLAVLDEDKYFALYLQQPHNLQDQEFKNEATFIYHKLKAKYFEDGKITDENLLKFRMFVAQHKQIQEVNLEDEIIVYPENYQKTGAIMIPGRQNLESAKMHDPAKCRKIQQENEDKIIIDCEMLEKLSEYLAKLKKEAKTNDLAKRIYESIDPNIVDILLRLTSSSDNIEVKPIYLESSLHQMIRNEKPELRN